jgi:hypothetical protein
MCSDDDFLVSNHPVQSMPPLTINTASCEAGTRALPQADPTAGSFTDEDLPMTPTDICSKGQQENLETEKKQKMKTLGDKQNRSNSKVKTTRKTETQKHTMEHC